MSLSPTNKVSNIFDSPLDLAEHHGVLCGLLCLRDEFEARAEWLKLAEGIEADAATRAELDELVDVTLTELASDLFLFLPRLPDDEVSLDERVRALAAWSEGFLCGLGLGGLAERKLPGEVNEFIEDLTELSRAEVTEEDGGEAGEQAYTELVEFLRIGAQLCYENLAPLTRRDSATIH